MTYVSGLGHAPTRILAEQPGAMTAPVETARLGRVGDPSTRFDRTRRVHPGTRYVGFQFRLPTALKEPAARMAAHRQEEVGARADPAGAIVGQPAARDHAVDVRMELQGLVRHMITGTSLSVFSPCLIRG